ncbi:MAG: hypothetical protein KDA35_06545 [Hyphomonadaceae bacterium]|nr:hypothetical protein [Hyphomonadaceae bacterium]
MILRRVIDHFRKQEWTAIAIDFVIVVIGVFIGIQVANWNEARLDAQRERAYLVALQGDFREVIAELEHDIARYDDIADSMTFLLEQSRMTQSDASLDQLNQAAGQLIAMEGTSIVSDTYSNLTGSGDLSIIKRQALKDAMASFFGNYDVVLLVSETHEKQLVGIFQPYIIDHLDYVGMLPRTRGLTPSAAFDPERIRTVLRTREFRNVVAVKWDIVTDLRNVMNTALEEARGVEALLTEELERNS